MAGGGVDVDAVDFAGAEGQCGDELGDVGARYGHEAATTAGVDVAVALDDDAGGVFVAQAEVEGPALFKLRRGGIDGDEFAVHSLGIYGGAVFAMAEALAVAVAVVAP